jgi:hypothetical protein
MIVEMRTYILKPGTLPSFLERFQEGLSARLAFSPLGGIWHSDVGALNQVVHVWPYESFEQREKIGQEARKTGKWPPKTQEFILTQESKILEPAPFSPPLGERELGGVYEIRTYTYLPGSLPTVIERWQQIIDQRVKLSPLAACWTSLIGPLNQFIHVWPYRDAGERQRIRAEAQKIPGWPPPTRELLLKQENALMVPAPFSPLR